MSELSTGAIYEAIASLEREIEFRRNAGRSVHYERARDLGRVMENAMKEYRVLSEALPRLRVLKAEADRAYDTYVTRASIELDSCSCHINPPCGYCTSGGQP